MPTISIYKVSRSVLRQLDESAGLQAIAQMKQGLVVDLTANIAMMAAKLSLEHNVSISDSIILSSGRIYQATVWTQDADFKGLDGIVYVKKR